MATPWFKDGTKDKGSSWDVMDDNPSSWEEEGRLKVILSYIVNSSSS